MTPTGAGRGELRLATRGSPLALLQARRVADLVAGATGGLRCGLVVVRTTGDALADTPIGQLAGQGVFVKEVQLAVLDGRADAAVHSAKDLPSATPDGLALACVPERADPRDVLVGSRLDDLAPGATVATGSARRRAQLAWLRPDLTFTDLRGNMATRVERAEQTGAGVLALAALERLGLTGHVSQVLDVGTMLPQVGQGALAVECRSGDGATLDLLASMDDAAAHDALRAERAFLAELGGGCTLPVGALATAGAGGTLTLDGVLASRDGRVLVRHTLSGPAHDPVSVGRRLARELLDDRGGRSLEDWAS